MCKKAIKIAITFLSKQGIYESKEEMWRRLANWISHTSFKDAETAAAAIISGDYDVESAYNLNDIKNFYFNGELA